ncbi:MAG: AIPR family protein [Chloroflexi bacterium]|nr:AIPR family protein [Chloroflexota bacterium]
MATAKNRKRRELYDQLSKQVDVAAADELSKDRAGLLLWFLSVVKGYDEADALEFICGGDGDGGIDGLLLEARETVDGERYVVTAFQSKYPEQPSKVGDREVAEFVTRGERLQHVDDWRPLIQPARRKELRRLVRRFDLEEKIKAATVTFRLHFVTAGFVGSEARMVVDASNRDNPGYVKVWDIDALAPAIEAFNAPTPITARVSIPVPRGDSLLVHTGGCRASVAAVRATDIVDWPGIEDRTLFNLNVRRQLPANKVRTELARATTQPEEHDRFLASHNGITVICRMLEIAGDEIVMHDPSVVNGAQSILAFYDNATALTDNLRVFVKICELDPASPFARDIAIRSNTQSAVNSRNLRALDGPQLRLQREFEERFPHITYETRPDASLTQVDSTIHNHQAAKCLCAVMNRRPWLAVKSLSLFEEPNYASIFGDEVHADQILLSTRLKWMVDQDKARYPSTYGRSWVLTSIIATYLAAEALRALRSDEDLTAFAVAWAADQDAYQTDVQIALVAARKTLELRRDKKQRDGAEEDFKVDFKNEQVLRGLGEEARKVAIIRKD